MKYKTKKTSLQAPSSAERAPTGAQRKAEGALGNATKLRTPPVITLNPFEYLDTSTGELQKVGKLSDIDASSVALNQRFILQDASREILYNFYDEVRINEKGYEVHHRTCTCTRFRFSETTEIVKSTTSKKAFYRGLMQCADVKTCPVCAAKLSERKANEMRIAFNQWLAMGKNVSLLTLTSPHTAKDNIDTLVSQQSDALSRFWRGEPAKRFKKQYGITGHIRSFEIKHGKNGWHPHFHILIFSDVALPIDKKSDSYKWIFDRWVSCSLKAGLSKPNDYGMDIRDGSGAGDYISKYGNDDEILSTISGDKKITWDMADEMTKGHLKTKGESLTPFQILANYIDADNQKDKQIAKRLFLEYARSLKGKTLLKWSRGLRDLFGLGHQKSDDEIIKEETDKADFLCHLTVEEWDYILKNKLRSLILDLANRGGLQAVATFLSSSSILSVDEYLEEMQNRVNAHVDGSPVPSISIHRAKPKKLIDNSFLFEMNKDNVFDRALKAKAYSDNLELKAKLNPDLFEYAKALNKKINI